ncbi:MAG: DUF4317 domain-containing protein [Clostridia bacterium]|nr:DUF4317 domain-containing protein [Clostridia bacterium]
MNKKDIAEIKRRFNLEHNNITCIRGCYVNNQGEVISSFTRSLVGMAQEEAEKYLAIFKRTLSGTQGQNLLDISFDPETMENSPEYQLLTALKNTALKDDETVEYFFRQIISNLQVEDHYLILLMHDGYDIPYRSKEDDSKVADMSNEVFHYVLCSLCPVRLTKPTLSYDAGKNDFRSKESDWIVGAPEMGFLFPAFEERAANIYQALYYTRDTAANHDDFVNAVFQSELPMPADQQKEIFQAILQETLEEDCSYEVVQAVHEQVMERLEEKKQEKDNEPLQLTKYDVTDVLAECGVSTAHMEAFNDKYDQEFGQQGRINAVNVTNAKQFEVKMPSVVIKVNSDRTDLVETRVIDGHPYILIRADEGVEVNGVNVNLVK